MYLNYNLLIENGALGVLSKTSTEEQVINAIRHTTKKEVVSNITNEEGEVINTVSLNEDEKRILVEVSKGKTNREIAEVLNLSQRSVEYKLTDQFYKLKVASRMEAVQKEKELWLIPSLDI